MNSLPLGTGCPLSRRVDARGDMGWGVLPLAHVAYSIPRRWGVDFSIADAISKGIVCSLRLSQFGFLAIQR